MNDVTLLLPLGVHPAIEERYASWQSELLLRHDSAVSRVLRCDMTASAAENLRGVTTEFVLIVTDPLLVASPSVTRRLREALGTSGAFAAVPVTNESANPHQRRPPAVPYLTLRQFEEAAALVAEAPEPRLVVHWDQADPGLFFAVTASIAESTETLSAVLNTRRVVVVSDAWVHRFSSHRGQLRSDILDLVPLDAERVLEFGCGEAALGAAIKARQSCRVVGMELDPDAAAVARTRIDAVHSGDVRDLLAGAGETFDCVVGGDVLEHLDEPWSFLESLRSVCDPGAKLILSLPNISAWPIVADLLQGRFDYVYMGITCAGHLRFFTRKTISEMLEIAGWQEEEIRAQPDFVTPEFEKFAEALDKSGIPWSRKDLVTTGYYVIAINPGTSPQDQSS